MDKKVYAIVGMAGSGKSEVIKYLQEKFQWQKVYLGEATFDRIKAEGLEVNYENEKIIREKIREELGMGAYAILALPKVDKLLETNDTVLIESLYSWDEYKIFKEKFKDNFKVIAVHANPEIRFQRMVKRTDWRPMKEREELDKRDRAEIEGTDKGGPIAIADYMIVNEGTLEEYHQKIDEIIAKEGM